MKSVIKASARLKPARLSKQDALFVALLIVLGIATHIPWFDFSTVLTDGDWGHWPDAAIKELYFSWSTWLGHDGIGRANIQIPFYVFKFVWSLLGNLGFSYDDATKLTFFIPIALLSFLSPYILSRKLTGRPKIALITALFYGTTTYGIVNQVPFQFVYALAPLILYAFILALEKRRVAFWAIFAFIYSVGIGYEVRLMYIVTFILAAYFAVFHLREIRLRWKNLLLAACLILGFNFFWLIPSFFTNVTESISGVTSRGLWGGSLYDLPHAFTIFNWIWTGGEPDKTFTLQPVIWYFWIFPVIAFLPLFFQSAKQKKQILFFLGVSLVGIFLTKQSKPPLPGAYEWLYYNFPGFNLFREASKFYLITALGYLGLISYSLLLLQEKLASKRFIYYALLALLAAASLWTTKPLITGEIGVLFKSRLEHEDYQALSNKLLEEKDFFRTLWAPAPTPFTFFSTVHPRIDADYATKHYWEDFLFAKEVRPNGLTARVLQAFVRPYSDAFLDLHAIKYVIVPFYKIGDEAQRDSFIAQLDNQLYLKRVETTLTEFAVYENSDFRPHIYITEKSDSVNSSQPWTNTDFIANGPARYTVNLKNIKDKVHLNFAERYDESWGAYVGNFSWIKLITSSGQTLDEKYHGRSDIGLNQFILDPKAIKNDYPPSSYQLNLDGSIDVTVTLYFRPQLYFNLGLTMSGLTLFICAVLIVRGFVFKKRYEKA